MNWLLRAALLSSLSLGMTACKQGEGERCQVNADCAEGLICVLPAGAQPQAGGSCQGTLVTDMAMQPQPTDGPTTD